MVHDVQQCVKRFWRAYWGYGGIEGMKKSGIGVKKFGRLDKHPASSDPFVDISSVAKGFLRKIISV